MLTIQIENQWSYSTAGVLFPRGEWFTFSARVKTCSHVTIILTDQNGKELTVSSENPQSTNDIDGTSSEYLPLSDVLEKHLTGCTQCQESLTKRPVANLGGGTVLCSEWFDILRDWAKREGEVNNVVAHDEFGNFAHKSQGEL